MKRDSRAATVRMPELLVRAALADFDETEGLENSDDLLRLENGWLHGLRHLERFDADKLRLQCRLAVFEKHRNNFLKVFLQLVNRFAL